jgi:hypothetical protein
MSDDLNKHPSMKSNSGENLVNLEKSYQDILETKTNLFKTLPEENEKKWKLQSIKTEIGVSAEGTLGVMGAGGEAAMELVWIRKGTTNGSSSLVEETAPEAEEIQINGEMTQDEVLREITPVVDLTVASHSIRRKKNLLKNLLTESLKFQQTIRELESTKVMGSWYPYKYQLELYVSVEGDIFFFEVGNSVRLRLEWWRLKKDQSQPLSVPFAPVELSENAKFIAGISSDLEAVGNMDFDNGFKMNCLKIGVGTTVTGNLFIVKGKASAIGSIFFKRDEIQHEPVNFPSLIEEVSSYEMKDEKGSVQIPRMNFRAGIQKGANIAAFFARNAQENTKSPFELNVIEAEFNLFTNGGIGIVNVEGIAVLTLFVTRNVTI